MPTDIAIAHACKLERIEDIAKKLAITEDEITPYGRSMAKIDDRSLLKRNHKGKVVLVTAITPTSAGEGKTTVSIGLADALSRKGERCCLALREPSLGPVFGMKGGATGGGHAQVVPMEEINLHFTGDLHAITSANNLIAALLDNSIQHGNKLNIDPRTITWRRCMDMNDRQMRFIVSGLGGKNQGTPREEGFDITAASETMATFCLAENLDDLKQRLASLVLARTYDGKPITLSDLHGQGAAAALLSRAIQPNLVQTLEGTPAFIHGGPFANIAHGCNSVVATESAMHCSDIVVTEAGFGADLGAEKYLDIASRGRDIAPSAVVLVATVKALKCHGGAKKEEFSIPSLERLEKGFPNLDRHIENIRSVWNLPVVVAINRFTSDTEEELEAIEEHCKQRGVPSAVTECWAKGGAGTEQLAERVLEALKQTATNHPFSYTYADNIPLRAKIEAVAKRIYHADGVDYAPTVLTKLKKAEEEGFRGCPVCIAKTQYSFSDDPKKLSAPTGFRITIRDVKVSAGAGFVVAYAGDIMTMPGLPEVPAAEGIDVDAEGDISGLF